jgi:DNA-directed RNA polymerase subunit RPC12/RpoP
MSTYVAYICDRCGKDSHDIVVGGMDGARGTRNAVRQWLRGQGWGFSAGDVCRCPECRGKRLDDTWVNSRLLDSGSGSGSSRAWQEGEAF